MSENKMPSTSVGADGEDIAKAYLLNTGATILRQNFHSKFGEIDLIVKDQAGCIIFVEVKNYKPYSLVHPLEAITKSKIKKLLQTVRYYQKYYGKEDEAARFDIIVVESKRVKTHLVSAITL